MTMPSQGQTQPQPGIDPATGLPIPQNQGPAPVTINMPPPAAPPEDPPLTQSQFDKLLNAERERVRKEEKDKLYPQIEEQQRQLAELQAKEDAREAERVAEEQRLAEEERVRQEESMTALQRLEEYKSEQDVRFAALEAERDRERVLREKEQEFGRIQEYRARRMAEESGEIAPQFLDYITGVTEDQIEVSLESAKSKTAEIVAEFQQAQLGNRRQVAPPISGTPPVDPGVGEGNTRTYSPDDIRGMDMSEYAANRQQLLGAASQRARESGPYAP